MKTKKFNTSLEESLIWSHFPAMSSPSAFLLFNIGNATGTIAS